MSELKRDLKAGVAPRSLLTKVGEGLYIKSFGKKSKRAYDQYYFLNPDEKKETLRQPIPDKVIDFIVDSFKVEPKEVEEQFKTAIKPELKKLNKVSKTARKLISLLYYHQEIKRVEDSKCKGYVLRGNSKIYLCNKLFNPMNSQEAVLTLLHETGHLREYENLILFSDPDKIYCDQYGKEIYDFYEKIGVDDRFKQGRLQEAEKRALTEQIRGEICSFEDILGYWFKVSITKTKLYVKIRNLLFQLEYIQKCEKDESKLNRQLSAMSAKLMQTRLWLKAVIDSPCLLFSKEGIEALSEKVFKQGMASRMKELILPKISEEKHPTQGEKGLSQGKKHKRNWKSLLDRLFLKGQIILLQGLYFHFMSCYLNQRADIHAFFSIIANSLFLGGAACILVGTGVAIKQSIRVVLNQLREHSGYVRDNWCENYNQQEREHTSLGRKYCVGNKNKMDLFMNAFCHNFGYEITPEDIKKSRTDRGEIEKMNKQKRLFTALNRAMQIDLYLLGKMLFVCNKEKEKPDNSQIDYFELLFFSVRKRYVYQKKKASFQKVAEAFVLNEIKNGSLFENVFKKVPLELIEKLQNKSIKKEFLKKVLAFRKEEFYQDRDSFFKLQRRYFKLLGMPLKEKVRES